MKNFLKKHQEFFYALILSITTSFMFFIVEPITLYANNTDDFWFDLPTIFPSLLLFFGVCFAAVFVILFIFYIISRLAKKPLIFQITFIVSFVVFLILYIHGNFFSSALPTFNGEIIHWRDYMTEHIISAIICVVIVAAAIFTSIKFKPAKIAKITAGITLAIFAMLSVSLVSTLLTTDATKEKEFTTYATTKNLNTYSKDENFLILLMDATDSAKFTKANKEYDADLYEETFADFTYFPDTVGAYRLTRDSIPFIFSGAWNHNEIDFATYSTNAFNNSYLFNTLKNQGYLMGLYDDDVTWRSRKALMFENMTTRTGNINTLALFKQIVKYDLFKYLPYPLKKFSRSETINFANTSVSENGIPFEWYNIPNYQNFVNNAPEITNQKVFQFVHLEGAHVPHTMTEDLEIIEKATYAQKCVATLKIINAYLARLREAGIYDNSTIIIMADHGSDGIVNQNPILFIKGQNEKHALNISEKAIWYPDLQQAYKELLEDKTSTEIFKGVGDELRDRIVILNPWKNEDHMTEYVQKGHAWDLSTLSETGNVYDKN